MPLPCLAPGTGRRASGLTALGGTAGPCGGSFVLVALPLGGLFGRGRFPWGCKPDSTEPLVGDGKAQRPGQGQHSLLFPGERDSGPCANMSEQGGHQAEGNKRGSEAGAARAPVCGPQGPRRRQSGTWWPEVGRGGNGTPWAKGTSVPLQVG